MGTVSPTYKRTLRGDMTEGLKSEIAIKPILEKKFGSLTKTSTYHPMDYEGDVWIEIKTRTFNYSKYPTTMIPYTKIEFAKTANKPVQFIFVFTDGIYMIEYTELFNTFNISEFQRTGRDVIDVKKDYVYIPINCLEKIE